MDSCLRFFIENDNIRFNFCMTQKLKFGFRLGILMKEKLKLNIFIFQLQVLEQDLASSACGKQVIVLLTANALNSSCRSSSMCPLSTSDCKSTQHGSHKKECKSPWMRVLHLHRLCCMRINRAHIATMHRTSVP